MTSKPLRASIGQIYYFQDRKVTLPDQRPDTDSSSDIVADLKDKPLGFFMVKPAVCAAIIPAAK